VAEGERFEGELFRGVADVVKAPIDFSGALETHGRGFLMIEVEPGRGRCRPAAWVSLYGDARQDAERLTALLEARITAAFGAPDAR
jgi:hypothetical protein